MSARPDDPSLIARGSWGEVRYATRESGKMEARLWIVNAPIAVKSKFAHLFRKMASTGEIYNEQHFRKLTDAIYEFKRDGDRILCFEYEKCWYLTHHYAKSGQKCPPEQIIRAEVIRREHLARKGN